ncbi:MAG: VCBS repeat-containing protein [Saprospiraceae bacterium]|nr:VCBS repeat-containing protein [Saprospiraceae bacterium]
MKYILTLFSTCIILSACSEKERLITDDTTGIQMLKRISPSESGLDFSNKIVETETINAITFDGMLQGAGVAILDANNDGKQDIYFASNMEGDRLYLNKGNFKFEDITDMAGLTNKNWSTGTAVVDINNDGYDDVYVCKFMFDDPNRLQNVFYINNGDGTFTDKASQMGLADAGYSIMANFFDMDRDGDLDVYIANQPPNSLQMKSALKGKVDYDYTDRLYRNDNGRFTDITERSGITNYSYSLSATSFDYNKDGWVDIYVACDYDEADLLYKNNGDGTFTNVANEALKHMSNFSMGVDIADINNDGYSDVYVADMVAEDNFRIKTNMSGMNPAKFFFLAENGYHYQYMFNALQLNNGDNSFSEIAQLSGVSNTDWSWTPLFVDFDQDGYKDLAVTNGLSKDMRNKDFEIWRKDFINKKLEEAAKENNKSLYVNPLEISKQAPSFKISNYVYKNNGDLSFTKVSKEWGFDLPTWSQGMAYADFDQDGDLDVVVNNMDMVADLYQNQANENYLNNYIAIELEGPAQNTSGINAEIQIEYAGQKQTADMTPFRGYMSTSQDIVHFGLGAHGVIDKISVIWPDNKMNVLENVAANQTMRIKYTEANNQFKRSNDRSSIFASLPVDNIQHKENDFDDYAREVLLPYRTSTLGPVLAKGDLNGDGLEDLYLGGSKDMAGRLLLSNQERSFDESSAAVMNADAAFEDGGALFFDMDGDNDLDLYVSSGGNESAINSGAYFDRIYKNDGKGNFTKAQTININVSSGPVAAFDMDNDADLDLFVGGRQLPGAYGRNVDSYILENQGGKFKRSQSSDQFKAFGMVTDALTADVNGDDKLELILSGEWMAIRIFDIQNKLTEITDEAGLTNTKGWWNTIAVEDVDGDGDNDIIGGNLGHNIKYKASMKEPFKLYVDDFDQNGTNDVYLGFYENGQCFPVRGRQCSSQQMPFIKKKFETYKDFGLATIDKVLEDRITETTTVQEVQTFSNTIFINNGNGQFTELILPNEAQISPVYGIAIDDFDKDGSTDIFLAGNMYQREVETTRSDAGKGCLITLREDGSFDIKRTLETGVSADKDVRDIAVLNVGGKKLLVIANNNDALQVYQY